MATVIEKGRLYPREGTPLKEADLREVGMQVVVISSKGEIFVRRDRDGHKTEAHVFENLTAGSGVQFLDELPKRLSSVSGGVQEGETFKEAALGELGEEMEDCYTGDGELRILSDIPYFVCYQQKNREANLLAGVVAIYRVSGEEERLFEDEGRFWQLDTVARQASPWHAEGENRLVFRPAFQVAMGILKFMKDGLPGDELNSRIEDYNRFLRNEAIQHCRENQIPISMGEFRYQT